MININGFILLSSIILSLIKSEIPISFKTPKQEEFLQENYLDLLAASDLIISLYLGSDYVKIKAKVDLFGTGLYIFNNSNYKPEQSVYFNYIKENNSSASRSKELKFCHDSFNFKCKRSTDLVSFGKYDVSSLKMEYFLVNKESVEKYQEFSGVIGLDFNNRYFSNWQFKGFLSQLSENNIIGYNNFFITFNSFYEGKLIFGLSPDELKSHIKQKDYLESNILNYKWKILIDEVRYKNKIKEVERVNKQYLEFKFDFAHIIGSSNYMHFVKANFFEEFDLFSRGICEIKNVKNKYNYFVCTDYIEEYMSYLPQISFLFKDGKVVNFKTEELFYKREIKNQKPVYVFLVAGKGKNNTFYNEEEEVWIVGRIFLRKIDLFFDLDKFEIGIHFKDSNKINFTFKNMVIIISGVLLFLIFLSFLRFFVLRKKVRPVPNNLEVGNELLDDDDE